MGSRTFFVAIAQDVQKRLFSNAAVRGGLSGELFSILSVGSRDVRKESTEKGL